MSSLDLKKPEHVDVPLYDGRGNDRLLTVSRGLSMVFVVVVHIGWAQVRANGTSNEAAFSGWAIDFLSWMIVWVSLFFVVGGALMRNSHKIPYRRYLRERLLRLLVPYYAFVVIMVPIEIFLSKAFPAGVCGNFGAKKIATWIMPLHEDCLGLAQGPLWFIQVFLVVAILAPFLARLFDSRFRNYFVPVSVAILAVFDYLWVSGAWGRPITIGAAGAEDAGLLLAFVVHVHLFWMVVFYLGFYYTDGYTKRFQGRYLPIGIAFAGITMVGIVGVPGLFEGPYGPQLFGYLWDGGNQFPATLAWLSGTLAACFLALWARKSIVEWSWRPRVEPVLDWLSANSLTLLIWHMVAYEIVYWGLRLAGALPFFEETLRGVSPLLERFLWLALTIPLIVAMVNLFAPLEHLNLGRRSRPTASGDKSVEPARASRS